MLLQISTQGSIRIVINLDCRLEEVRDLIIVEEDEVSTACSPCRKYRSRLQNINLSKVREDTVRILQSLSLFDQLQSQNQPVLKPRPRAKARVINYFLIYSSDPSNDTYSDYCRVKLILHYLFTDQDDLLIVDNQSYELYIKAFQAYYELYSHPPDYYPDLKGEAIAKTVEESKGGVELNKEDVPDEEDNYPLDTFKILARRRPNIDLPLVDGLDTLGNRDLDRNYDQSPHISKYDIPFKIWDQVKAENPIE